MMENYIAEFIGTMLLIIFGDGTVANVCLNRSKGQNSGWIVIATGWGLGVAVAVYSVGRISGAHINPAVTLALASIGAFPWAQVPGYIVAQILGAFAGGVVVWLAYLKHWELTESTSVKLGIFSTIPQVRNYPANFLTEAIATVVLVFGVLAIGANAQELRGSAGPDVSFIFAGGIQPLLIGVLVWAIGLSLGGPTGYAINPARDLGPRLAHWILPIAGKGDSDWKYAWIPVIAPLAGGIATAFLYSLISIGSAVP
jgi:glycerol uptake facilitator protein